MGRFSFSLEAQGNQAESTRRDFLKVAATSLAAVTFPKPAAAEPGAAAKSAELPIDGPTPPELVRYDELMTTFMRDHQPPGAALAVAHRGRLVYAKAFGFADGEKKEPVKITSLFRIASISKPFTAVAIFQLIEQGKLRLEDKVFSVVKLKPHLAPGARVDPRLAEITVRHCLQHTAGWDRSKGFDPMGAPAAEETAKALRIKLPVRAENIIQYTLGKPLDFDPGTKHVYSNFGYCVLGRVIEAISGMKYDAFVAKGIFKPLGITRMRQGKNLLKDRAPDEVKYYERDKRTGRAISGLQIGRQVPLPYGYECIETMDANGGWIASVVDLVRFATAFDDPAHCPLLKEESIQTMLAPPEGPPGHDANGNPKHVYYACGWDVRHVGGHPGRVTMWHRGGLAGSETLMLHRGDETSWAVLFNGDKDPDDKEFAEIIDPLLHQPADEIKHWPEGDLFEHFYPARKVLP